MDQPTVLIISDDADFSGAITGRWQAQRSTPAFTLMSGDLCHELDASEFDLAIVGSVHRENIFEVLGAFDPSIKPVVLVCENQQMFREVQEIQPRVLALRQHEGWLDALVLLVSELLKRCEIAGRLRSVERSNKLLQQQATLGTYMLEMRHNLNNALTSVLGNSELLLLEPGSFNANCRSQIETIRNMSLRMHEILQRFSSLEKELAVVARQADRESHKKTQAAAASY